MLELVKGSHIKGLFVLIYSRNSAGFKKMFGLSKKCLDSAVLVRSLYFEIFFQILGTISVVLPHICLVKFTKKVIYITFIETFARVRHNFANNTNVCR